LLGNSVWNVSSFLASVALNLLVLPFVLFRLGANPFGVASLVVACTAPALAFSNALALSTTRELAGRLNPGEREDARHIFGTALFLALAGGAAIATTLFLVGPTLARWLFHLRDVSDLDLAFRLSVGGWLCQCVAAAFIALFIARQDYARVAAISLIGVIVSTGSILALVPLRPEVSTYLGCQALGFAAALVASCVFAFRRLREWMSFPASHDRSLRHLAHLGSWQFVAQISGVIAAQVDRYLLGAFLAPTYVGYYTIAQRLEEAIYIGVLKVGDILFPFFSSLQKGPSSRMVDLLFRSSWVLNVLGASALGALIPVAGPLLKAWTGIDVAIETQGLLVILAVAGTLGCTANVFGYYLLANGQSRDLASIAITTAAATLATSAVLLPLFGWKAAGWSACCGMLAQFGVTMMLLRRNIQAANIASRVVHLVLQPLATGIVAAIGLRYLLAERLFDMPPRWWFVGIAYAVSAGLIFLAIVAVSTIGPYRRTCWQDLVAIARHLLPHEAV
jgi:O-antigen/teichoic acid export membrane protein